MKQLTIALLLFLLSIVAPLAEAAPTGHIPLWGATSYGMSLNEVLSAVPGAQRSTEGTQSPFPEQNAQTLARLENISIAGRQFSTWFMFRNNKLSHVILFSSANTPDDLPRNSLDGFYSRYLWLLELKYGKPIKTIRQEFGPPITAWYAQWVSGMTNIDLNVDETGISITYGTQFADDLSKL